MAWVAWAFYGRENAEARGESVTYERYMDQGTSADPFAIDLSKDEVLRGLYLENERYDGYFRDQNVFGQGITIEDSMSLLVKYHTGPVLNYSLNAYLPREGFQVAFNGSRGRLEYEEAARRGRPALQTRPISDVRLSPRAHCSRGRRRTRWRGPAASAPDLCARCRAGSIAKGRWSPAGRGLGAYRHGRQSLLRDGRSRLRV